MDLKELISRLLPEAFRQFMMLPSMEEVKEEYELMVELKCEECGYVEYRRRNDENDVVYAIDGKCPECGSRMIIQEVFSIEVDPEEFPTGLDLELLRRAFEDAGYPVEDIEVRSDGTVRVKVERRGDPRTLAKNVVAEGFTVEPKKAGELIARKVTPTPTAHANLAVAIVTAVLVLGSGYLLFGRVGPALEFSAVVLASLTVKDALRIWTALREGLPVSKVPLPLPVPAYPGYHTALLTFELPPLLRTGLIKSGLVGMAAGFTLGTLALVAGCMMGHVPSKLPLPHTIWTDIVGSSLKIPSNPVTAAGWTLLAITWISTLPVITNEGGMIVRACWRANDSTTLASTLTSGVAHFVFGWVVGAILDVIMATIFILRPRNFYPERFLDEDEETGLEYLATALAATFTVILAAPSPFAVVHHWWPLGFIK